MADMMTISAERREDAGKGASRRLRRNGKVPGILYGGDEQAQPIQMSSRELWNAMKHESFFGSLLMLEMEGEEAQRVILRDLHRHPFKQEVLHFDFMRVRKGEKLYITVPIHFLNEGQSEAAKTAGVVISHRVNEVEIRCLPRHVPEALEIDLSGLEPGDAIKLSEIPTGDEIEIPALVDHGPEQDVVVVVATFVRQEPEPDAELEEVAADEVPTVDEDGETEQTEGEESEDKSADS